LTELRNPKIWHAWFLNPALVIASRYNVWCQNHRVTETPLS